MLGATAFLPIPAHAQKGGGNQNSANNNNSSNSSSSNGGGGGGGGSIAIESEMIAYDAIDQLAIVIGSRIHEKCGDKKVLLALPANLTGISTYGAFEAAAKNLQQQFASFQRPEAAGAQPQFLGFQLLTLSDLTGLISTLSGVAGSAKASTSQTSATFTPVDQALYSNLERELGLRCELVTTAYPNQVLKAYDNAIAPEIAGIQEEQRGAHARVNAMPEDNDAQKAAKTQAKSDLQKLDTALTALQASVTDMSSSTVLPNVLLGAALANRLGPNYWVLTLSDNAAGGGTRANQIFLLNLFLPAPHPSYNGGAVVSYSLRDQDGAFGSADTLRMVFGYTKWHQPARRTKGGNDYTNVEGLKDGGSCSEKIEGTNGQVWCKHKGHWTLIY
jgi:hypothetical protein